jgi:transposase-like protein
MGRRSFSREFKLEAVRLVRDRGVAVAQAARDLDVHENVLRKWMTDHPRFEPIQGVRDEVHLRYHGGRLVDLVLRLADRWQTMHRSRNVEQRTGQTEPSSVIVHSIIHRAV